MVVEINFETAMNTYKMNRNGKLQIKFTCMSTLLLVTTHSTALAALFDAISDQTFTFHQLSQVYGKTTVKCAIACALNEECKAVNARWSAADHRFSCELLALATENSDHLATSSGDFYVYRSDQEECSYAYAEEASPCPRFTAQDAPYGWQFLCSTGYTDISAYDVIYQDVICERLCAAIATCVFYQVDNDRCLQCIHDDAEYNNAMLIGSAALSIVAHVRAGIDNVMFTSSNCDIMYPTSSYNNYFIDTYPAKISLIRFCTSSWYAFDGTPGGYMLQYINGHVGPVHGCNTERAYPFPDMVIGSDEAVIHVRFCIGSSTGYHVLQQITVSTTKQVYGPIGISGHCTNYDASGYNLLGFHGSAATAIDNIGAIFERC